MKYKENYKKAKEIVLHLRKTTDMGSAGIVAELKRQGYQVSQSSVGKWCLSEGMPFRAFTFTEEMRSEAKALKEDGRTYQQVASIMSDKYEVSIKPGRIQWELSDQKKLRIEQAKLKKLPTHEQKKELWEIAEELEAKGWSTARANTEVLRRWTCVSAPTKEQKSQGKSFSLNRRRWAA